MSKSDFNCPNCGELHTYHKDFGDKWFKSKSHIIQINCNSCKKRLEATIDMTGQGVVWLKYPSKNVNRGV